MSVRVPIFPTVLDQREEVDNQIKNSHSGQPSIAMPTRIPPVVTADSLPIVQAIIITSGRYVFPALAIFNEARLMK